MSSKKQEAFLALYQPVHDRFERFCRARVFGQMEYSDLMNETLLIAFQKFDELKSEKAFLSFLFGICIRVLSNYKKKKKALHLVDEQTLLNISGEDYADSDADVHLLYRALGRLPVEQKESIILFEITGFSIREIALLHGVSESAVKQRLVRGRKKLAKLLCPAPPQKIRKDHL